MFLVIFVNQRELLTFGVVFVNWYDCFMGNNSIIRTCCGCKPSKRNNIEHVGSRLTPRYTEYQKVKKGK